MSPNCKLSPLVFYDKAELRIYEQNGNLVMVIVHMYITQLTRTLSRGHSRVLYKNETFKHLNFPASRHLRG